MIPASQKQNLLTPAKIGQFAAVFVLGWTVVVVASLWWNIELYQKNTLEIARNVARTHVEKDLLYRKWNTDYGGVYAPVSAFNLPNPYMATLPNRDISGPTGQKLTLVNPSHMARQIFRLGAAESGIQGHITSLNPLHPDNLADDWESKALHAFEQGAPEYSSYIKNNGQDFMRFMIPIVTEKNCLKCHAPQGYRIGDIRGGISVTLPMEPFWSAQKQTFKNIWFGHIFFWFLGIFAGGLNYMLLMKRLSDQRDSATVLANSEARFRELFNNMTSGVAVLEARDKGTKFIFVDFNRAAEKMDGVSKDEVVGKEVLEIFPQLQDFGLYQLLQNVWQTGKAAHMPPTEFKNTRMTAWRENWIYKLPSGEVIYIFRDITQQKIVEENLRQAQKMEALGTLAGGVAHDFNNILTAIIGYAELSIIGVDKDDKLYPNLEKIIKSSRRATELVKQILTFSRQTGQEQRVMLLQQVTKETLKLLRGTIPSTIKITQDIDPACRPVLADVTQIHQVIMNLCTNAYHAMREKGGVLKVTLKEFIVDEAYAAKHPGLRAGEYALLAVNDSGHGMDEEQLGRIFDPYYTTKGTGEGTGLGLAIVLGIVSAHRGAVTVESQPGHGSTFNVFIPLLKKPAMTKEEKVLPDPILSKIGSTILFVDDEEDIVNLGEKILNLIGCKVVPFTNSLEALKAFDAEPQGYDMIITDQTMPGLTGFEFARKALEIRPDIPIILSTGYSETVNEAMAKELGIKEFILKPHTVDNLTKTILKLQKQTASG